jgi:hypothetical protein
MQKIRSGEELRSAIFLIEQKKEALHAEIENEMVTIQESLTVSGIVKNVLQRLIGSSDVKTKATSSVIGLGSGFIAQKIIIGGSKNIFKRILGTVAQIVITGLVAKNSTRLASKSIEVGKNLLH